MVASLIIQSSVHERSGHRCTMSFALSNRALHFFFFFKPITFFDYKLYILMEKWHAISFYEQISADSCLNVTHKRLMQVKDRKSIRICMDLN